MSKGSSPSPATICSEACQHRNSGNCGYQLSNLPDGLAGPAAWLHGKLHSFAQSGEHYHGSVELIRPFEVLCQVLTKHICQEAVTGCVSRDGRGVDIARGADN